MTRRELLGCLLLLVAVLGGRLVRHNLMVDAGGGWREPGWLTAHMAPTAAEDSLATATAPPSARPAAGEAPLPAGLVDPNTSPADSLCLLPGIGPALAARIVAARETGVHFARARDLQAVRGIGPRTVARLEPYLAFSQSDSAP